MRLLATLVKQVPLPGWGADLLPVFSSEEIAVIEDGLSRFQRVADSEFEGSQGGTYFHPEAAEAIRRMVTGDELISYANAIWQFEDELPGNWRIAASAYMKAWAAMLNPTALQNLGELLAKAGENDAARATFSVILEVPNYAAKLWGEGHDDLAEEIVAVARESLQELG